METIIKGGNLSSTMYVTATCKTYDAKCCRMGNKPRMKELVAMAEEQKGENFCQIASHTRLKLLQCLGELLTKFCWCVVIVVS